ncbi:MAG: type I phosphomannose isomerase catalytic subunit [Planctomycetota bacterium]
MLYPLRFDPIFREYIWGGRRLETVLGKTLGDAERYAESWEVVDRAEAQSVISAGPWAGRSLSELMSKYPTELMGAPFAGYDRYPLLFKFLDCNRNLSVQVHPNDAQGALLDPPDLGKTEAWYVMAVEPGAAIYAGLQQGVDRQTLAEAVAQGTTAECLHRFEPRAGDCVFIPAGTVHALGEGLVVAEIQQSSDTTYRLFDWNRVDADGKPRPLHIHEALDVIDYAQGPVHPQPAASTSQTYRQQLVSCDKFVLDRVELRDPTQIGGDDRAHLLAVLQGEVVVAGDPCDEPATKGSTVLIPADQGSTLVSPEGTATVLDIYLP